MNKAWGHKESSAATRMRPDALDWGPLAPNVLASPIVLRPYGDDALTSLKASFATWHDARSH